MKKLFIYFFGVAAIGFASCNGGGNQDQQTRENVIDRDTTSVEYEVERQKEEVTIERDTTTETETVEKDLEQNNQNQGTGGTNN